MSPAIATAVDELRAGWPESEITAEDQPDGGAAVTLSVVSLGPQYRPEQSWIGFTIPYNYPYADVYPLFTDPSLAHVDGTPLGEGFQQQIQWNGRVATQISRRSNGWDSAVDTAATKLRKVQEWLLSR